MLLQSRVGLAITLAALLARAAPAQEAPKLEFPRPSPNGTIKQTVGFTDVTVAYSSPAVRGRKIWGSVVPYNEVWRAGANECTKVTFSTAATVGGKSVPAGTYSLFLLPTTSGWTFILNKDTSLWGADGYKASEDLLRVPATATSIPARERLAFSVLDFTDAGGTLAMEWDTVRVGVKFELTTRATVLASLHALKSDDWKQYNRGARYLLDTSIEPAFAMQLADKSIQLKEDWENLWTKAQLLAAAGNTKAALPLAQRAQTLGKTSKNFFYADEVAKAINDWKK
jgi:Protein of unknown function (DUF2911)